MRVLAVRLVVEIEVVVDAVGLRVFVVFAIVDVGFL